MARIVAGIGTSHSPQIGFAHDNTTPDTPGWGPIHQLFEPVAAWLEQANPDVVIYVYNDHLTSFFFDHYSPFVLGVDDEYVPADEGGGPRTHPSIRGHAALARHLGISLFDDHFDLSFFRGKPIDHGLFSPMSMMTGGGTRWSGAVVPLQVGVLQFPVPTACRCFDLGRALARAVDTYDGELDVAVIATGGLSHQVHGERAGFNNLAWDERFLDLIETDPHALTAMTHTDYAELGGAEGIEVILWLIMRGALSSSVSRVHRATYHPSMTNLATLILANDHDQVDHDAPTQPAGRNQLAGIERLTGTYPFTLERSAQGIRLNTFLHALTRPDIRARFAVDPSQVYADFELSAREAALLEARDWLGLLRAGAIFFGLEKLAAVLGLSNVDIYAQFRNETIEQFQATRNVSMRYSVAPPAG